MSEPNPQEFFPGNGSDETRPTGANIRSTTQHLAMEANQNSAASNFMPPPSGMVHLADNMIPPNVQMSFQGDGGFSVPQPTPPEVQPANATPSTIASQVSPQPLSIQPLLSPETDIPMNFTTVQKEISTLPNSHQDLAAQTQKITPKPIVTKVKLTNELNIFDWQRTRDIINHIAERAKSSVDSVITVLDPGMKEYLYSGGNINIMVISDSDRLACPVRDAFQSVFGRATVSMARQSKPESLGYPVKLACGFNEAIATAQKRIKNLRLDSSNVPQNQVIVVIQPTLVIVTDDTSPVYKDSNLERNLPPQWFLTYCMMIEDPVLGLTMSSYSQFIPMDNDTVACAKEAKFPDNFSERHLGFAASISDLMNSKLHLAQAGTEDHDSGSWLEIWSGLDEMQVIHGLGKTVAHLYRSRWSECVS